MGQQQATAWKNAKMVIIVKKGNKEDLKNYRPICLLQTSIKYSRKDEKRHSTKTSHGSQLDSQANTQPHLFTP